MKKTDIKKLLCTSISAAVILSLGSAALAEETELPEEDPVLVEDVSEAEETDCEEETVAEETEETCAEETGYVEESVSEEELSVPEETSSEEPQVEDIEVSEVEASNNSWKKIDGNWYYYRDGSPVTGWQVIGGKKYLFSDSGAMKTGICYDSGKYYIFDENGVMLTGWQQFNGRWYYLLSDGKMVEGWQKIDNKWYYFKTGGYNVAHNMVIGFTTISEDGVNNYYYFNEEGVMQTGWFYNTDDVSMERDRWYYFNSDGTMATGWKKINNKWYYFHDSGEMHVGMESIDGKLYLFNESGYLQKGWVNLHGHWYYCEETGVVYEGWKKIDGKWYYFSESDDWGGLMATGPCIIKNRSGAFEYYYFDEDGVMRTNFWYKNVSGWRYFGSDGKGVVSDVVKIGGKYYGFDPNGIMITYYDGTYLFGDDGVMKTNCWYELGIGVWTYFGSDGKRLGEGWHKIDGKWYCFVSLGWYRYSVSQEGLTEIDGVTYFFGSDHAMRTGWIKYKGEYLYAASGGKIAIDSWVKINKKWYYFDSDGYMVTGYMKINNTLYHFDTNGVCLNP